MHTSTCCMQYAIQERSWLVIWSYSYDFVYMLSITNVQMQLQPHSDCIMQYTIRSQLQLSSAVKWESGLFIVVGIYSRCALLPHLQGWFMALTQATLVSCLYLVKIKENHSFIIQTERVCLHSRQASLESCNRPASHLSDLAFQRQWTVPHVCKPVLHRSDVHYIENGIYGNCFDYCLLLIWSRHFMLVTHREKAFNSTLDFYENVSVCIRVHTLLWSHAE